MQIYTNSPEQTESCGKELAKSLDQRGIKRAFIALRGEMGVGKTAFTRGFASYFGIECVKSPTYTIVNEYRGDCSIYHFDMYRITDGDDLYSTGYDEYIESDGYSIVEWSENIDDFIPEGAIFVSISRSGDNENGRTIEINENFSI